MVDPKEIHAIFTPKSDSKRKSIMKEKLVTAALIKKEGKYLIARRAPSEPLSSFWEFPGGKIEENETPEQCLIREIKEELEIDIEVNGFFQESVFEYGTGKILLLAYHCTWLTGEIVPSAHDRVEWHKPEAILMLNLLPADIPIVESLRNLSSEDAVHI